jgi:hypothetical protein
VPINQQFTFGLRLASGEPGTATSYNVTMGQAVSAKNILLERVWLGWTPSSRVAVTGGKFALPLVRPRGFLRSELIFDEEVTPEGLHEEVTLHSARGGLVRRVALLGEQWMMSERAKSEDSWMLGGQAVLDLAPAEGVGLSLAGGYYGFANGDLLAEARNANPQLFVTNSVVLKDGTVLEGGKALTPSATNPFVRFVQDFRLVSGSVGLTVDRALGGRPIQAYLDVVHNTGANAAHTGWWAGLSLGQIGGPGDWAAGAVWSHVEQESVLSMYSYSDLGFGGTNVEGPMLQAQFRPVGGITLSLRHHIIQLISPVAGVSAEPVHRLQLDVSATF